MKKISACIGGLFLMSGSIAIEAKTLNVWVRDDNAVKVFDAFNKKMQAEGKDIQVNTNVVPLNSFAPAFSAALSAGEPIDLVSIDLILVPYYSKIGALTDITDFYNSLPYKDELNSAMLHLGQYDGKTFGLPNAADVSAISYNKDLLRKAGVDPEVPPTNWKEFEDICQKVKDAGMICYTYSGGDPAGLMFTVMPWAWANGGSWLNIDGTTAELNHPQTVETFSWLQNMLNSGYSPESVASYSWNDFRMAFLQGQTVFAGTGSFWLDGTKEAGLDFGVIPFFSKDGSKKSAFVGGDLLAIPSTATNKEDAFEVIKFIHSEEIQVELYAKNGTIPVIKSFIDNKYFQAEPRYKVFAEAAQDGFVPYTTKYNELYSPFLSAIQNILLGKDVEESLNVGNKKMQGVIDRR